MALVLEAVTLKGTDDGVTGGTYTFTSTLVNGSGNDRALVVIASGRSGAIRTVVGFDSVSPGAVFDEISVDGGNAVSTAVGYFVDADLPASSGSHNITVEWSSTFLHKTAIILEFSGADQTTPLENWGENSGTDIATSGTLAATLAGANAEFGASYLSITDNASYATPGGNTLPSGWTDQGAANEVTNLIQLATNTSVPSASEVLTWTIDPGGTSPYTSCVTGCFSVKAAAAAGASVTASVSETGDTVSAAL